MRRRELFKSLVGVGVVSGVVGSAPEKSLPDATITDGYVWELDTDRKSRLGPLLRYSGHEIGRVIEIDPIESAMSRGDRWRYATKILWADYRNRVEHGGKYTSPRFTFVPASKDYPKEIYGYYAEAIERI